MAEPPHAVGDARREWSAAVNAGDLERYARVVSEDVVWLPPAGDPIEGRDAFRRWLAPFFAKYAYDFAVEPTHVREFDGWCAELGRFGSMLSPVGDPDTSMEHTGRYFVLWRRDEDGTWRIERYFDGIGDETMGGTS